MTDLRSQHENGFTFSQGSIGHWHAARYGAASTGTVIFIIAPQILLLYFLTAILRIPPAWAGAALLAPKLIEFAFDIAVGIASDRQRSRMGRRMPFMLVGALLFPIAFAALFSPPVFVDWRLSLAWVTAVLLTATLAYTLFSIPYITMVGEMSDASADRLRVTAWRMAFVSVGVLVAGGVAPAIVEAEGGGRSGYAAMGAALAVIAGASALICLPTAWRFRDVTTPVTGPDFKRVVGALLRTPAYVRLWLSYVLQMAGVAVNAAMLPFAVVHQLRASESTIGEIFVAMTVATLAAMPLAVVAARRIGSVTVLAASLVLSGAGTLLMTAGSPQAVLLVIGAACVFGAGQSGATSLPFALLPEAAASEDAATAARNAGLFTAVWVAGEKLRLAIGGALTGWLLAGVGYVSGAPAQSPPTIAAIPWLFGAVPAALLVAAALPLAPLGRSTLNRKSHS